MDVKRQEAFQKLRPPCVELSSVALKFRTSQVPVKDVLHALESLYNVLDELSQIDMLDHKLADYAFFPLAQQIFNETLRLSPRCIETAVNCVTILVSKGFQQKLGPELGKQLLILMTMIAGADPQKGKQSPTDEVQSASFRCIGSIVHCLSATKSGSALLDDQGTKNVVDQLVYLLVERIQDSISDNVQISASKALRYVTEAIRNRVFLASLLPRTVSALTKALRPSTSSRRTQVVLATNLSTLQVILTSVLADELSLEPKTEAEKTTLDRSWLTATAAQVKNALIQVTKVRSSDSVIVCEALKDLCVCLLNKCHQSLAESMSILIETMVILSNGPAKDDALKALQSFMLTSSQTSDTLRQSLLDWLRSMPRLMSGADDRPKGLMLNRITAAMNLFAESQESLDDLEESLTSQLLHGVASLIQPQQKSAVEVSSSSPASMNALIKITPSQTQQQFESVILNKGSQRQLQANLKALIGAIQRHPACENITRAIINAIPGAADEDERLAALWLAINLLRKSESDIVIDDFLIDDITVDSQSNRDSLLNDLAEVTLPLVIRSETIPSSSKDWRITALALEAIVLNAERYPSDIYRPELINTLYPVLSILGSSNSLLRDHAMTALNKLALTCKYPSTSEMIIENADYLVNSIAWNLNTYNLTPEAPQILRMMVILCGSKLIPYLEDLVQSIFAALDNYHAYPNLVELLFVTLKTMVDESVRDSQLNIEIGTTSRIQQKDRSFVSSSFDILDDLKARKRRKLDFSRDASEPPTTAPQRPWTSQLDGPTFAKSATGEDMDEDDMAKNDGDRLSQEEKEKEEAPLTKSHQMLLSIANATAPHFASPSPRVRKLLLDLLSDISPLLGRHENTFLPLINSIWPVVVPRLFAEFDSTDDKGETAYNVCAAADTISILCQNAGDFMSSPIESIFQQLLRLFRRIFSNVTSALKSRSDEGDSAKKSRGGHIRGPVQLDMVKESKDLITQSKSDVTISSNLRTSKGQILNALVNLLLTILKHVRLTLDSGDEIFEVLIPLIDSSRDSIRDALKSYNSDMLWLADLRRSFKHMNEMVDSSNSSEYRSLIGDMPKLKSSLGATGINLYEISV